MVGHHVRWLMFGALAAALVFCSTGTIAAESPEDKLVLVLSGGGARGAAHIGVLRVLEELHIAPDLIVGTSMGSIVGGLYAAGWSPDEIEYLLVTIDWNQVFTDKIPRKDKSFRRKQDDRPHLVPIKLRFDSSGLYLPSGLLGGQSLWLLLNDLEARSTPAPNFDDLPVPYRAVATDIERAQPVVISEGSLATAMRASMAIPGMFAPVILDGKELVDGGSVANLPIGIAQDLGATQIIAIDISSPLLAPGEKLESFLDIYNQMNSMLTVGNRVEDVKRLKPGDVYVRPELGDISFMSFDQATEAVAIGEAAARAQLDELRRFTADDERWQQFISRQRKAPTRDLHVDSVRINNTGLLNDKIVENAFEVEPAATLDTEKLREALMDLYHLNSTGVIGFELQEENGRNVLEVDAPAPAFGPNSLQFGFSFFDDFSGGTGYTVSARHLMQPINRHNGEWENTLQVGSLSAFRSEFYQPFSSDLGWFVAPAVEVRKNNQEFWYEGDPWATFRRESSGVELTAGRVFGNWGELSVGAFTGNRKATLRTGDPIFPDFDLDRGGVHARFRVDTENSVIFPRRGMQVDANYTKTLEGLRSDREFEKLFVSASSAWSIGNTTLAPYFEYGDFLDGEMDFFDQFFLGGPGRLSGLGNGELWGTTLVLARLSVYERLKHIDLAGIRIRLYAGISGEAGNVFSEDQSVTFDALRYGGNVFIGADSPLGNAYLGYGWTDGGRRRWFLTLGDHF